MILFVIATRKEAKLIFENFSLKCISNSPFAIYRGKDFFLLISGIGKLLCASAISYFFGRFSGEQITGTINVGIAGHKTAEIGEVFLAHQIIDFETSKSVYPCLSIKWEGKTDALTTLNKPCSDYLIDGCLDMEGYGFFRACQNFLICDVIYCLKIISDNQKNPLDKMQLSLVSSLISRCKEPIFSLMQKVLQLSAALPQKTKISFKEFLDHCRFTTSEKLQLETLLKRLSLLDISISFQEFRSSTNAKQILKKLKNKIFNG